jgi:chondroitin 4-sulfotransferase 11
MNQLTRLLWQLIPEKDRSMLLSYAPQYQQRHIDRILKGRAIYQPCFDKNQCLFIHIPKSAGRSVVRGLFDVKSVEHAPADWYQKLDPEKYQRYFKFTFVRNPWDRLVSAYTYLAAGGANSSEEDSLWSNFINQFDSFDEFVCEWISSENVMRNALLTPQTVFLKDQFGQLSMDFIGRFETLETDFSSVADRLGLDSTLPHLNKSNPAHYRSYYSDRSREIVAEVYAEDIDCFSYHYDP